MSHIPKEIPDIAARFRDDDAFRRSRESGNLLNSLATLIQGLRKVSHIPKEIPDIAARFRDDDAFRRSRESGNLLKQSDYANTRTEESESYF